MLGCANGFPHYKEMEALKINNSLLSIIDVTSADDGQSKLTGYLLRVLDNQNT